MCGKTMQWTFSVLVAVCVTSSCADAGMDEGAHGNLFDRRIGLFVHYGIPADRLANETVVLKLDFTSRP